MGIRTSSRASRSERSEPPNDDGATTYARDVCAGRIVAGLWVRKACERHLRDLARAAKRTDTFPFVFDRERAQLAVDFFSRLTHTKGEWAGQPIDLSPWEQFIIGSLHGWVHRDTGLRRYRQAYVEVARKNGKSTLGGGESIQLAFFDNEPGAEVYCAATKKDQAKIVWGEARRMVLKKEGLRRRIVAGVNNLHSNISGSKLEPLGADADTLDGLNTHAYILDELHAHKSSAMVDVMETSTAARRQPLGIAITTAGTGRESICRKWHEYSRSVLQDAITDETWFAYIAAIDDDDDPFDESVWVKANPNLGVSVKIEDLRRKAAKAKAMPAALNGFLRLHMNRWTEQVVRAIPMDRWDGCRPPRSAEDLIRIPCAGGLDLGQTNDLSAFALAFEPEPQQEDVDVLLWFWMPEERIQEPRTGMLAEVWERWVSAGLVTLTPGNVTDTRVIRAGIERIRDRFRGLRGIWYDPWQSNQLAVELQEDGARMIKFGQSIANMAAPTREFLRLVAKGALRHGGHPVLRWMASNAATREDSSGNLRFDKGKSSEKIDGIVAVTEAIAGLMDPTVVQKHSVYARERRGLHVL